MRGTIKQKNKAQMSNIVKTADGNEYLMKPYHPELLDGNKVAGNVVDGFFVVKTVVK